MVDKEDSVRRVPIDGSEHDVLALGRQIQLLTLRVDELTTEREAPFDPREVETDLLASHRMITGEGIYSDPSGAAFVPAAEKFPDPVLMPRRICWGKAALPANREGIDDSAWLRPEGDAPQNGYVYVTKCLNLDGEGAKDNLKITREDEKGFVKVAFVAAGAGWAKEPNVRADNIVPYVRVGQNCYAALGAYRDDPVYTPGMWGTADDPPAGWYRLNPPAETTVYYPNVDVETTPTSWNLHEVDLRQHSPIGAGDHPSISGAGLTLWAQAATNLVTGVSGATPVDLGFFGIHIIVRIN